MANDNRLRQTTIPKCSRIFRSILVIKLSSQMSLISNLNKYLALTSILKFWIGDEDAHCISLSGGEASIWHYIDNTLNSKHS